MSSPSPSLARAEISLYQSVQQIKESHGLVELGIAFYDYETTLQWSYNADAWFHAASTMKLAVLLGVYRMLDRGELTLDAPVHVRNKFMSIAGEKLYMLDINRDSDPELYRHLGRTMPVKQLAYQMITTSSNFATNLLVDVVGVEIIQTTLAELGIEGVKVLRGVEDQAAFDAGLNNLVTANGLLRILRLIADGKAFSESASREMLDILPEEARVAHKTGNIATVHHDAGIVYLEDRKPYVLVILTRFDQASPRSTAVADVSRDIYECLAGIRSA